MPAPGPLLIGWSEAFHHAVSLSHRYARLPRPILLLGPSGVGKGLFARLIHSVSGVAGAFISVPGGELADSLYHAQLFGYEQGAFTGAIRQKRGAFEQAQGGTLFLDELPLWATAAQSAVLRALGEGVVRRLGAEREFDLNCRVVVASTISPETLELSGHLLPDLRWRLGEFIIRIPPLRERREDILPLAEHYRARAVEEFGQDRPSFFSREAVRRLVSYDWPGDVRRLKSVVEQAVEAAGHENADAIATRHLGLGAGSGTVEVERMPLVVRQRILDWALHAARGNRRRAAELAGVHVNTIDNHRKRRLVS